mgnify:CR=1 FL=1
MSTVLIVEDERIVALDLKGSLEHLGYTVVGVVSCGDGLSNCSGTCRDLQTDLANCGACGTTCPSGQVCSRGACVTSCATGLTDCSGACRDQRNDSPLFHHVARRHHDFHHGAVARGLDGVVHLH